MSSNNNILIAQGGGPTCVINQSLAGIIDEEKKNKSLIVGAINGVNGIINSKFINLNKISKYEINLIAKTPGAALGSTRDKPDKKYCTEIIKIINKKKINKFYYIGGNDSSDSLRIISNQSKNIGYDLQCIHVPKTIDNDLVLNDHTPGYGSAAKYVALLFAGINLDIKSLPGVYIGVVMGRHAGFLTASSSLLKKNEADGPHLIFLPEVPFSINNFLKSVKYYNQKFGRCIIAVSEGIQDKNKKLISEKIKKSQEYDAHGNVQLSGSGYLGDFLANQIKSKLKIPRVRADTLGYPQRSFLGLASEVDQKEAFKIGKFAVKKSIQIDSSFSAGIKERTNLSHPYKISFKINSLAEVAGQTKVMSKNFYNHKQNFITKQFVNYALPLIGKKITKTKSII